MKIKVRTLLIETFLYTYVNIDLTDLGQQTEFNKVFNKYLRLIKNCPEVNTLCKKKWDSTTHVEKVKLLKPIIKIANTKRQITTQLEDIAVFDDYNYRKNMMKVS